MAEKPESCSWRQLTGAGTLAGIGFPMSLIIAGQAFPPADENLRQRRGAGPGVMADCQRGEVIVISVDHRLAREHPYPVASEDGEDALPVGRARTLRRRDPEWIAVGGNSAGGHVDINIVQRRAAADRPAPAALLLLYSERSGLFTT